MRNTCIGIMVKMLHGNRKTIWMSNLMLGDLILQKFNVRLLR